MSVVAPVEAEVSATPAAVDVSGRLRPNRAIRAPRDARDLLAASILQRFDVAVV